MRVHITFVVIAIVACSPIVASAQTVDQLVADHALLNTELDRCKQIGMASVDDPRCKTAWTAENKRFFGNGQTTYTPGPVDVFPSAPAIDPQPTQQKGQPKSGSGPNG